MSKLEINTTSLQSILDTVNNLPSAGSGTTEDLTSEITTQDTLLSELEDVLANKASGGSSGGGSVETCTVTITGYDTLMHVAYTTIDNSGNITYESVVPYAINYECVCVCNSAVTINLIDTAGPVRSTCNNATQLSDLTYGGSGMRTLVYGLDASGGGSATIVAELDSGNF